jgi:hypothetical protein
MRIWIFKRKKAAALKKGALLRALEPMARASQSKTLVNWALGFDSMGRLCGSAEAGFYLRDNPQSGP